MIGSILVGSITCVCTSDRLKGQSFHQDKSKGTICHAEKGTEMATELLDKYPISPEQKANVLHCIRSHRFRGNHQPVTLEAKILP